MFEPDSELKRALQTLTSKGYHIGTMIRGRADEPLIMIDGVHRDTRWILEEARTDRRSERIKLRGPRDEALDSEGEKVNIA